MSNEVLVRANGVSKKFCRSLKRSLWYGVKDIGAEINPLFNKSLDIREKELRFDEFWALDTISFEVRRGECLGLIGHNGAGKTTLLRVLNGLIKPDRGRVEMRGTVGAIIALGAGFNPLLTGRENILVSASISGMSRRTIESKMDEIIDFSGVGDFIDAPVQSYSSGMQVRLGFAVATGIDPDILILDEVFAVGDSAFRTKCFKRIGRMANKSAIIFVSHDQSQVSYLCDQVLLLNHGKPKFLGETVVGLERYRQLQNSPETTYSSEFHEDVQSATVRFVDDSSPHYSSGQSARLVVEFECRTTIPAGVCHLNFIHDNGTPSGQVDLTGHITYLPSGSSTLTIDLKRLDLAAGTYSINFALFGGHGKGTQTLVHLLSCCRVRISGDPFLWIPYKVPIESVSWSESTNSLDVSPIVERS